MPSNITNKRAVLLTATIVPNSVYTSYNNPDLRLKEYLESIKFYNDQFPGEDVYLLENSDFDFDKNELYTKLKTELKFTLIKFPKSDKFYEGKGYQEFEMIDKAIEQLKEQYDSFIKITGRYIVKNAFKLTAHKINGITIDLYRREKKADTFFIYFTTSFYLKYLKNEYKNVNDNEGKFIEKVVYNKIDSLSLYKLCRLFPKTTLLSGVTGSYGITLTRDPRKIFLRNVERFFCNSLGIKSFFY